MNFIKTQKLLSQQAGQTEIPLESVLELMRTYLTELRYHTNTPVDRCPIGNMPQMVASLAAISNDILFVYRTNEKAIHTEENRFTQALAKAQKACGDYNSRIQELDAQIGQEQATREQLTQLQEQENNRSAVLAQLRQETNALQAQIDALRDTDPETEAGRLKALLETQNTTLAQLQEAYAAMQQEHIRNQEQLETENAALAQLRTEVDEDYAKLKETAQIIKDQQDIRKELELEYCKLEHQAVTLKNNNDKLALSRFDWHEKIDEAQAVLDETQGEVDLLRSLLAERQTKLEALKEQYARDKATAQELEAKYTALEAEHAATANQITTLEQAVQTLTATLTTQYDQRIALDDRLQQLEEEMGEILRLRREQDDKVLTLDEALTSRKQDLTAVQVEIDTKNAELSGLTLTHQEKADQLTQLNADIENLENELQLIQEKAALRRTQIAAAEESLEAGKLELDTLVEQLVTVNVDLEAQKTDNENFRITQLNPAKDKLAAQVLEVRKDRDQLDEIRNSIKLLEGNRASLGMEIALLMSQQKSTQASLDAARTKHMQIQTIVAELEEQLRIKGAESAALLKREKELRELLDEKNVAKITAELEASNKQLEEDIRQAEQKERDLADNLQKLHNLQQKLTQVQAELEDCRNRHNDLLSRHESATLALNRITCEENRRRCETLHNQLLMMQAMTEQLMSHSVQPCGQSFDVSEELNDSLYQAECTITTLRKVIQEYTTMRQNTLENCE